MNIVKNLVPNAKYNIKCPYTMEGEFFVVHNTANSASARNEIAYMINNDSEVSFHYAIDDKEIVQGIPENRNAWHAGDGNKGAGNRKGIALEICYSYCSKKVNGKWVEDKETWEAQYKSKFIAAEKLAAKFIASKLKEKGWGIDRVKKHQDFSNKYCPHRTLDMGWERFLKMIENELNDAKPAESTIKEGDIVTVSSNAVYYNGKDIPDWVIAKKWIVKSVSGDRAVIDKSTDSKYSINSPVNVKYLTAEKAEFKPYQVKITATGLFIRKGPGINHNTVGLISGANLKYAYTIVDEANGAGATKWGKLKSGAGWISLDYVRKI